MLGQPVDVFDEPVGVEPFDGLGDPRVNGA
jgi:hypothetical protein